MKNDLFHRMWQREGLLKLAGALAGTGLFIVFLIWYADPLVRFFLVVPVLIFSFLFLLTSISIMKTRRAFLLLSASGMILLIFLGFAATSWQGSPERVQGFLNSTNCVPAEIPNATSPNGYVNGTRCTASSNPFFSLVALAGNLFFWFLVSGLVCFAMPVWEKGMLLNKITRNFFGAAVAAALVFLVICSPSPSGIPYSSLSNPLVPINPYSAFALCDSSTFFSGHCISVNIGYLLLDYFYWLAVCSIVALTASEFWILLPRSGKRTRTTLPEIPVSSTVQSGK